MKFNSKNPYKPALSIFTQLEAEDYLSECILWLRKTNPFLTSKAAYDYTLLKIGEHAQYFNNTIQIRMEILFGAINPKLGSITKREIKSTEKIIEEGISMCAKTNNKSIY